MDGGRNTLEFLKFPHQIVDEDYFDFDSILAENTNVSCLFESITPDGKNVFLKIKHN
jgi:hypothetical protein